MKRLVAATLAIVLFGCSASQPVPPDRTDGAKGWSKEVPQSKELAGRKMEEIEAGPWVVRRTISERLSGRGRKSLRREAKGGEMPDMTTAGPADGMDDAPMESGRVVARSGGGSASGGASAPGAPSPDPRASPPPMGGAGRPSTPAKMARDLGGTGPAPALRAAKTDDNEKFEEFLEFLATWSDRPDLAGRFDMLDVRGRQWIRVVNAEGKPVPAAEVRVVDLAADRVVLSATTYGDGRVPFYPHLAPEVAEPASEILSVVAEGEPRLVVEVAFGDVRERRSWDGKGGELQVEIPVAQPVAEPVSLDVLFMLDTTGSMGDEIDRIKASLLKVTEKLRSLEREFDLRYGAVLYRDIGDEYVTKAHPFTGDIRSFDTALAAVRAKGGGDGPESLNQGLAEAVGRMDWRDGAARVMFLIADAPPHMDYAGDVRYGETLKAALARGIRIHSVAASGIDAMGSLVFRQIAQFTRGKFIFIEYGTVERSAAAHGVKGVKKSNNLDDILFDQIREEVALWGRGD